MAVDKTPWFVGADGVLHSAEVARVLAYAATGGSSGVIGPTDLKVTQLSTPGGAVQYMPGGAAMLNRYPGGGQQSYIGRAPTAGTITVPATTSSGGRSDLVIARVRDPQYGVYTLFDEGNPNEFEFFSVELVQGVAPGTNSLDVAYPHTVLARIDIPSSTSAITSGMITDLRQRPISRSQRIVRTVAPSGDLTVTTSYRNWPNEASGQKVMVTIPKWATKLSMITSYSGIEITGPITVGTRGVLHTTVDNNNGIIYKPTSGLSRESFTHVSTFSIPAEIRGSTVAVAVQAMKSAGTGTATLDYQTTIAYDLFFEEVPE